MGSRNIAGIMLANLGLRRIQNGDRLGFCEIKEIKKAFIHKIYLYHTTTSPEILHYHLTYI
jgi:hypothetical protein